MDPIKRFQITGLILSGFKCFSDTAEFAFAKTTVVTGGNGRGKSSLADAIAFAVTGLPFFGERFRILSGVRRREYRPSE